MIIKIPFWQYITCFSRYLNFGGAAAVSAAACAAGRKGSVAARRAMGRVSRSKER
jgi:hypothetical protein